MASFQLTLDLERMFQLGRVEIWPVVSQTCEERVEFELEVLDQCGSVGHWHCLVRLRYNRNVELDWYRSNVFGSRVVNRYCHGGAFTVLEQVYALVARLVNVSIDYWCSTEPHRGVELTHLLKSVCGVYIEVIGNVVDEYG